MTYDTYKFNCINGKGDVKVQFPAGSNILTNLRELYLCIVSNLSSGVKFDATSDNVHKIRRFVESVCNKSMPMTIYENGNLQDAILQHYVITTTMTLSEIYDHIGMEGKDHSRLIFRWPTFEENDKKLTVWVR